MVDRSDKITGQSRRAVYFSDFLDSFDRHPVTGQLARVTNEDSVKQALRNLILTSNGERLYQPLIGGNVKKSLFEPIDDFTTDYLADSIKQTIFNNERRVAAADVKVVADPDNNAYTVTIYFMIFNSQAVNTVSLTLTRVR
jgi:phage baseplate assembly protein W